jgi:alkylation response protein AidB-like acyl-CoA dehydrogenase
MLTYSAPVDDMHFLLEAFGYERVTEFESFKSFDLSTVEILLKQTGRFFSEEVLSTNSIGDRKGVNYDSETFEVTTPSEFNTAWKKICEQGLLGMTTPTEYGGSGGPYAVGTMLFEMATATNKSLSMFAGLSDALTSALLEHATEKQKETWIPKLVRGEWTATMAMTEPQCGTDLSLIRTQAEPRDNGTYDISGHKIWIGCGEHDLTDNILHFVLARLPNAPEGTEGLSAFVVPKILADGTENQLHCSGIAHKMGMHASPTCEMRFDRATGYLVGERHQGMEAIFVMLNEARRKVGSEGVALSEIAYQTALSFAEDRRQSRAADPKKREKGEPADNILVHPDVRRMLADVKTSTEGMRALITWVGVLMDLAQEHPEPKIRQESEDIVSLLTPVIKAYCTEKGFENVSEAMQVTGGAGYTADLHIEQYLRDVRIGMLYGGTNHIQALDLVEQKLPKDGGRLYRTFQNKITELIETCSDNSKMQPIIEQLEEVSKKLTEMTTMLNETSADDRENADAVASNYLRYFALTAIAYAWARQIKYALDEQHPKLETKLKTCQYFFDVILPETQRLAKVIEAGKEPVMAFDRVDF